MCSGSLRCVSDLMETMVPSCSDVATDFSTREEVSICGLGVGAARLLDVTSFDSLHSTHGSRVGRNRTQSTRVLQIPYMKAIDSDNHKSPQQDRMSDGRDGRDDLLGRWGH
jgi:hypothetical protein